MRKLFFSMLVLFLSVASVTAQSAEEALKGAKKAFDSFALNQDATKLTEAVDMINKVMGDATMKDNSKALIEAGDIYSAAINAYVVARSTGIGEATFLVDNPAVKAAKAYMVSYDNSDPKKGKKYRKAALKGLQGLQGNLSNEGIYAIQDKSFENALMSFQTSIMVHEFLGENGGESALTPEQLMDEQYYGGLSALLLEDFDTAEPMFLALYEAKYDDAAIYDGLYKVYEAKGDMDNAYKVLQEGRKAFPDENSLLFTEINYYLSENKLDQLTGKLEEAISKEPENVSLYATLGQVYEKLYTSSNEEGNEAAAKDYYMKAQNKYEEGLTKDPGAARLIYALGAMIYNRGAAMSQQLVDLESDFSKEGQKKYDALKEEVDAEFSKALPYFQKAEMSDPNDLNTLIALKEMYARNSEYEVSGEFKARIEKVQAGEKNEKSYFKEKGM
jgi:tetratricopeptide (TPR) repeat protein